MQKQELIPVYVLKVGVKSQTFKAKGHSLFFEEWERNKEEQTRSSSKTSKLHINCPVTKRTVTNLENGLTLASFPQTLSYFCANLVLVSLYK